MIRAGIRLTTSTKGLDAMAEEEWGRHGLFDPAHVRRVADEQIRVEQPPDSDVARATSPPAPDPHHAGQLVVLHNPPLAAIWFQGDTAEERRHAVPADQRPDDASSIAQLGMALYLLQSLHTQDTPGFEHLARSEKAPPDEDDESQDA